MLVCAMVCCYESHLPLYELHSDAADSDSYVSVPLLLGVWALQPTTGEKPPPLDDHTFIKIDNHRAVVFGGYTGTSRVNDTYVLDMETWVWRCVCDKEYAHLWVHT